MNKKYLLIIPIVIIIFVVVFGGWLYTGTLSAGKQNIFQKTSLPVASVGGTLVSGKDFINRYQLAVSLLKNTANFNDKETREQTLSQIINNLKLTELADNYNVSVSSEQIDSEYKVFVQNLAKGDEARFVNILQDTYKLTPDQFRTKVLVPDLLTTALTVWFNEQENQNQAAYSKQKQIMADLSAGKDFSSVAKSLSEDDRTKNFGGDTGFVNTIDLLPEFEEQLKGAKINDIKQIISRSGIHTVKVLEIDETNNGRYHLQQIFVKEDSFDKWYADQSAKIKTRTFIKL